MATSPEAIHLLKRILILLCILLVMTAVVMLAIGKQIYGAGVLSFEFCGFSSSCDSIVQALSRRGRELTMLSLGLDVLLIALYTATIYVGLLLVSARVPNKLVRPTIAMAWLSLSAGIADVGENYQLARLVLLDASGNHGIAASTLATIKFIILALALTWIAVAYLLYVRRKRS